MPDRFRRIKKFAQLTGKVIGEPITTITVTPVEIEGKHGFRIVATDETGALHVDFDTVTKTGNVSAGISGTIPRGLASAGLKVVDIAKDIGDEHRGKKLEFRSKGEQEGRVSIRRSQWGVFSFDPGSPKMLRHETCIVDPDEQE